jgi:hypothetical protein
VSIIAPPHAGRRLRVARAERRGGLVQGALARARRQRRPAQRSKSFSRREAGSLDLARPTAIAHRDGALEIVRAGDTVLRPDRAAGIVLGDLFEDPQQAHLAVSARRASLALLRAVLRWGRRRYPRALSVDVSGLFQVPSRSAGA